MKVIWFLAILYLTSCVSKRKDLYHYYESEYDTCLTRIDHYDESRGVYSYFYEGKRDEFNKKDALFRIRYRPMLGGWKLYGVWKKSKELIIYTDFYGIELNSNSKQEWEILKRKNNEILKHSFRCKLIVQGVDRTKGMCEEECFEIIAKEN